MSKLALNILVHNRNFLDLHFLLLSKIKSENKEKINVNLLCTAAYMPQKPEIETGIETNVLQFGGSFNYFDKISWLANQKSEFLSKIDDDIFIMPYALDFIIENIDTLNNNDYVFIQPEISNGIPSVDYFSENFIDEESKKLLYDIYLDLPIDKNCYGVIPIIEDDRYCILNKFTIDSEKWNANDFWEEVSKINHTWKGVHPARMSEESQVFINDYIINNIGRFFYNSKNCKLTTVNNRPYACSGAGFFKSDIYKEIISDESLKFDSFEETMINTYCIRNNKKFLIGENCRCIHPYYNTVNNYRIKEIELYNKILGLLNEI